LRESRSKMEMSTPSDTAKNVLNRIAQDLDSITKVETYIGRRRSRYDQLLEISRKIQEYLFLILEII